MDIDPSTAYNYFEEIAANNTIQSSDQDSSSKFTKDKPELHTTKCDTDSSAAFTNFEEKEEYSGFEPVLGGELREKAVWVDEGVCIGCQYCVHVATNTFIVDESLGRSRVIRQNGDTLEIVQEAIDTCPVDCIHWVDFEDLEKLDTSLNRDMFQSLGKLHRVNRY